MDWKIKAEVFRLLSVIPGGDAAHYWLQRNVTRTLRSSSKRLDPALRNTKKILQVFQTHTRTPLSEATFLEFGAGRDLAGPLGLAYGGVRRVIAIDISPLAKVHLVRDAVRHMAEHYGKPTPKIETWSDLAGQCRVHYEAPADARDTRLLAGSVDCVTSWNTLEHITADDIRAILVETRRILRATGIVIMQVDYADHYARVDKSITVFNFLQFSDRDWSHYDSRFQYQNRMRHSQYIALFEQNGFQIIEEQPDRNPANEQIMKNLAGRFKCFSPIDLFTSGAFIVAKPAPMSAPLEKEYYPDADDVVAAVEGILRAKEK